MEKTNKIFLIGFMGSGKTTLGKRLANKLNITFFDLDAEIEQIENRSINEIFKKEGEEYFRNIEHRVLNQTINNNSSFVLSLGGGTPCYHNNMDQINQAGKSIYLKYNAGILSSRLINAKKKRPLIKGLNEQELTSFVENKLKEREIYYGQSKYIVERSNLKVEDLIKLCQ